MERLFQKFAPLCAMVMTPNGDSVDFLGTAFAVDAAGYLATAAHVVKDRKQVLVSPATDAGGYQVAAQKLRCIAASVVQLNELNDIALLKFDEPIEMKLPPNLFGELDRVFPGAPIAHLGYPFGNTRNLVLAIRSGCLAAKLENVNGVRQLYVESVAYSGAAGGPLLDVARGNIIGLINSQLGLLPKSADDKGGFSVPLQTDLTIATPIQSVMQLLEKQKQPSAG